MKGNVFSFRILILSTMLLISSTPLCCAAPADDAKPSSPAPQATDFSGTWSGTLFSKRSSAAPFTITIVLNRDSNGRLAASASHNSNCLREVRLEVSIKDSQITLAGGDEEGNNVTVRGNLDRSGTMLKAEYILNGSASGRCESDTGTGTLAKR
jgi:hypothetical protein